MMKKKNIFLLFAVMGNAYAMDAPIELRSGALTMSLHNTGLRASDVLFSPTVNQLAITNENQVSLHSFTVEGKIEKTNLVYPHISAVRDMSFDATGKYFVTCEYGRSVACIYSAVEPKKIALVNFAPGAMCHVAFNPKKKSELMLCDKHTNLIRCEVSEQGVAKEISKKCLYRPVPSLCFNSTGQYLIIPPSIVSGVDLYKVDPMIEKQHTLTNQNGYNWYISCADPVHNRLALAFSDKADAIEIYDLDKLTQAWILNYKGASEDEELIKLGRSPVNSMSFDTTGTYLAVGFYKNKGIIIYNVESREIIHEYKDRSNDEVTQVVFSPDENFLVMRISPDHDEDETEVFVAQLS